MALVIALGFASGCGRGLTVECNATPSQAEPGDMVQWNISLRNITQCAAGAGALPVPSLPPGSGPVVIFAGLAPDVSQAEAVELCRLIRSSSCSEESCFDPILRDSLGVEPANRFKERLHAAMQAAREPVPMPAGTCETVQNDADGFLGVCAFDQLDPQGMDTATHSATVVGGGMSAQFAWASGSAVGEDCRPGTEVQPGGWVLAGCCPDVAPVGAPILSPFALYAVAALLLAAGALGLYRRRHKA